MQVEMTQTVTGRTVILIVLEEPLILTSVADYLSDEQLDLWAAASERESKTVAEMQEPEVVLKSMTEGREVVEDYTDTGLTLRAHPMSFLRNPEGKAHRHLR